MSVLGPEPVGSLAGPASAVSAAGPAFPAGLAAAESALGRGTAVGQGHLAGQEPVHGLVHLHTQAGQASPHTRVGLDRAAGQAGPGRAALVASLDFLPTADFLAPWGNRDGLAKVVGLVPRVNPAQVVGLAPRDSLAGPGLVDFLHSPDGPVRAVGPGGLALLDGADLQGSALGLEYLVGLASQAGLV